MSRKRAGRARDAALTGIAAAVVVRVLGAVVSQPGTDDLARHLARDLAARGVVAEAPATEGEADDVASARREAWLLAAQAGAGAATLAWVARRRPSAVEESHVAGR